MPKISVITVSKDAQKTIEKSITSVMAQTYRDFEYILADGNSKDKTLEIAGKYKNFIKKWISEPDKGKFDAMNKGVLLAQGEYIIFLNSGVVFASDDILEKISNHLDGQDIIYGDANIFDTENYKNIVINQNNINNKTLFKDNIILSTQFIKRSLLENMGGFDLRFKLLSDYEFNLRSIIQNKVKIKYINEMITTSFKKPKIFIDTKKENRYKKEKVFIQKMYYNPIQRWFYGL